jgi:hypothetical protein
MGLLERKRPVLFAGENPMITLYRPGTEEAIAGISLWRCTYSAHGEGFGLALWCDPVAIGMPDLPATMVFADNAVMARMVMTRFNQYQDGYQGRGLADIAPEPARFGQQFDGQRLHRITCAAHGVSIELVWSDVLDAALSYFDSPKRPDHPEDFEITTVICPCRDGAIIVDGTRLPGEVRVPEDAMASSTFLAFSETWVARE